MSPKHSLPSLGHFLNHIMNMNNMIMNMNNMIKNWSIGAACLSFQVMKAMKFSGSKTPYRWIVDDCWVGVGVIVNEDVKSLSCQVADDIQEPGVD